MTAELRVKFFYCKVLHISRQAFNKFLKTQDAPWKYQALQLKHPKGVYILGERTVYRVMAEIGLNYKPKLKPNDITKADRKAHKCDALIKRGFATEKSFEKCITDMAEIKSFDGKLYVSAIFDCYDLVVLGFAMDTNMKVTLCEQTLENVCKAYPLLRGSILHSDRGIQYTSELYCKGSKRYGLLQSMTVTMADVMIM